MHSLLTHHRSLLTIRPSRSAIQLKVAHQYVQAAQNYLSRLSGAAWGSASGGGRACSVLAATQVHEAEYYREDHQE